VKTYHYAKGIPSRRSDILLLTDQNRLVCFLFLKMYSADPRSQQHPEQQANEPLLLKALLSQA